MNFSRFVFPISCFTFLVCSHGASTHTVLILDHAFEPESVFVKPGDTVRWVQRDAAAHTVTGTGAEIWGSEYMVWGDVYVRVFSNEGSFDYVCDYHPMSGKVVVGGPVSIRTGLGGDVKAAGLSGAGRDLLGRLPSASARPSETVIIRSDTPDGRRSRGD